MDKLHEFIIIILAFCSELIGTLSGVSSSSLFVPVAVIFETIQTTLFLTACLHVIGNCSRIYLYWSDINWGLTLKFGIPAVLLTGVGAYYSDAIPKAYFSFLLGLFLISMSVLFIKADQWRYFSSRWSAYIGGGLSGLLTGALGSGGAIRSLALTNFKLTPFAFTATSTVVDFGGDVLRLQIYFSKGYADKKYFIFVPLLMLSVFAANWLAKKWLAKIEKEKFRKIVLAFVFMTGVISILVSVFGSNNVA